jgi:SSS family solute:Na+ symporter
LIVRDFLLKFRQNSSERMQVMLGRAAILVSTPLAVGAAYLIYTTPDGLYKYLQAVSVYLVMPVTPAIFFGIVSKRVNLQGAVASAIAGTLLAALFVADQLIGPRAAQLFPLLHTRLTLNYTYRGLWGGLIIIATLFVGSWMTKIPDQERLRAITVDWRGPVARFEGLSDWRLHLGALSLATIAIYAWLW